jgi:hypothetical protein
MFVVGEAKGCGNPCRKPIVAAARRLQSSRKLREPTAQRTLSRTVTWLRRLWAWLREPERCPECGLTRRKADIVRCPCDWRNELDD